MNLDLDEISQIDLEPSLAKKFRSYYGELCLRKHPDWRSEQEWRILLYSPGEDFKFIDISGSLCGIVLGVSFDFPAWRQELEDIHSRLALSFDKLGFQQLTGRGFGSPQFLPPTRQTK